MHLSRRLRCTIVITRCPSSRPSICLSVRPSLTFHIFDFSSETTEQNSTKLDRKQELNILNQVCVFLGRSEKQDGRPGLWLAETFSTSSETAERNSTKLDRNQDLNIPCQVCVFWARSEKQDGRPGLWLAETFSTSPLKPLNGIQRNLTGSKISTSPTKFVFFGLIGKTRWPPWPLIGRYIFNLLWNRWTKFNETWQEARSQRPLPSLYFSGRLVKQDGRPDVWLAETFSTSPLKPLKGI